MCSLPSDHRARERFTREWGVNLAVAANAGSGKTTAISERLAAIALSPAGGPALSRTTVVTYTNKAAAQIAQRARSVLLARMAESGHADVEALARLDRVFFGTIHSFCLVLARRHGSSLGLHLNPTLVEQEDHHHWHEFLEQDPMTFEALTARQVAGFLRHASLPQVFDLAEDLNVATARRLVAAVPPADAPPPSAAALAEILAAVPQRRGKVADVLARNQERARAFCTAFATGPDRLPLPEADGVGSNIGELYRRLLAPVTSWLAAAGGVLAAELALRYRAWRRARGIQTYADQVETALEVLENEELLDRIRAEGWRVLLDEAQDTDPQQFAVLVEITRPAGAPIGSWPEGGGPAPRPGHFCMVGDAQQCIYSDRADIHNFQRHLDAFASGRGGEKLSFDVTFRTPRRVVALLNASLPPAFGPGQEHNLAPAREGAEPQLLQVPYEPLVAGPRNVDGAAWRFDFAPAAGGSRRGAVKRRLRAEGRQLAGQLAVGGPEGVGAADWGDICILAPRTDWLLVVRDELERAGLKTALQMRQNRCGDNPVYAWLCGLLAVVADPSNTFEWVGVLREVFAVSDAVIAAALRESGSFQWDEPSRHPAPVAAALRVVAPFVERADAEGDTLLGFATDLAVACGLGARALALDPEGGLGDELDRLLARAAELARDGTGPRAWLADLLRGLDGRRAAGRPARDAVNLMTSHSSKGLEWPVVIPVGLGRSIPFTSMSGLRILPGPAGPPRLVLGSKGIDEETREAQRRAKRRDLVRLLYVTLTRARVALVVPWSGAKPDQGSFAELWGLDPAVLEALPAAAASPVPAAGTTVPPGPAAEAAPPAGKPAPALPRRVLPHQLAGAPDLARAALHESTQDLPPPVIDTIDPLDYGVWWHETLEFLPWSGGDEAVAAYAAAAGVRAAAGGFGERAAADWTRLLGSEPWRLMREMRWNRLAEVGVFAPLKEGEWIDGVIDLVLHDPGTGDLWVVDWKTNRRRTGEGDSDLLGRLANQYQGQLAAYGACTRGFFPGSVPRLWIYATEAGAWIEPKTPS